MRDVAAGEEGILLRAGPIRIVTTLDLPIDGDDQRRGARRAGGPEGLTR